MATFAIFYDHVAMESGRSHLHGEMRATPANANLAIQLKTDKFYLYDLYIYAISTVL